MGKVIDLSGNKYGLLRVLRIVDKDKYNRVLWECECDCGNKHIVVSRSLVTGNTKSCGCLKNKNYTSNKAYHSWTAMKKRCDNKNHPSYKRYGAKGITYAKSWSDFGRFISDMGERPTSKHDLDRIDNSKGYYPGNCRWVDRTTSNRNKTTTIGEDLASIVKTMLKYRIKSTTIAASIGCNVSVIYSIKHGRSYVDVPCLPV